MIKKLRMKFPKAILREQLNDREDRYIWFQDEEGTALGIPNCDITEEEITLLNTLFPPLTEERGTIQQQQWKDFLLGRNQQVLLTSWQTVRFIHFSLSNTDFSRSDFEEAFLSLIENEAIIIWIDSWNGVLIEEAATHYLQMSDLLSLSGTLESDFYSKLRFFVGGTYRMDSELPNSFKMEQQCLNIEVKSKISSLPDVFPFLFIKGIAQQEKQWFIRNILGEVCEDSELLSTVKTYIECNSNASLAAKQLYIHRNSLQYRIDKFCEKTSLDVKLFQHALTAYLAILLLKS